jgi:hypothetical protein
MCAADGCPVAVEVFEGNIADPATLAGPLDKQSNASRCTA